MSIDYACLVVSHEEVYMPKLQEVQNLKESRHCLALSLDDSRQLLLLDNFQRQLCTAKVQTHLLIKVQNSTDIIVMLARNIQGT